MSVKSFVGGDKNARKCDAADKSKYTKCCGEQKRYHPDKFERIAELVILLSKIGDGDDRHIEYHVGREPTDLDRKVTEYQSADDGQGV